MVEVTLEFRVSSHCSTYDDSLVLVETGCHVSKILNLSLEQRDERTKRFSIPET